MAITGMEFTRENFVRMWEHSRRQPQSTSQILHGNVGREVSAQITAADAEANVNAEATLEREMPSSAWQILALDWVGV